jgi:glycosyltransferase involved in cell wall biosynthesis
VKALLVSHTCMSRTAGQPKLHALAAFSDIELTALVPDRMRFYGRWQDADPIENPSFRYVIGQARWQDIGGQWYLQRYPDALARVLRETRPDVVDLWHEPWSLVCAQGVRLTRRLCPQAKIVVETEQNIYKRLPPPFQQFQNYVLRRADYAVARNQEAVDVLRRKGYDGPARVVPNAVDSDLFRPVAPEERRACRERLGWAAPGTFLIGYAGRLVPEKGLADALAALALMPENAHLLLAGEGPMRSGLEAQAAAAGLTGHIHFAGGKPLTELPDILNALDVLILPSRTTPRWKEQFGRVLIEAGACGIAVIGSDSGAIPEVIADAGLTFPEGDVAALADRLRRLRDDPDLRARYGQTGRERAVRLFSWPQVAAQMRAIYREMLGKI